MRSLFYKTIIMFKNKKELPELTREIVKQHTGLNRSERRIHGRHRVRN